MSADLDVEHNWQSFGRIAGIVVASLVTEIAVDGVCTRSGMRRCDHAARNHDVAGINTQFLCWIKGKALQLPSRILHSSHHQIIGQRKMHHAGDQLRRERLVGIDVEAGFYAEKQPQGSRMRWIDRYGIEWLKSDFFGWRSRSKRLLGRRGDAQSRCKQE